MRNAGIAAVLISAFGVAACHRSPETAVAPSAIAAAGATQQHVYPTAGYDAGTEANNEQFTQIVDPCQAIGPVAGPPPIPNGNGRVATSGVIAHHPGVQGGADLQIAQHGWRNPVARIRVERLK
ncbi:MAG: hypothetical protein M3541_14435 [Acidobacteriota bacterium]|nr:hypothetical protein [Acidobacteriota bacterium]